jgi:uncharacterized protein YjgD (DUF1641 family)
MSDPITEIRPRSGDHPVVEQGMSLLDENVLAGSLELVRLLGEHREALKELLELVELLHERGFLRNANYLLREWHQVYMHLTDFMVRPGSEQFMKNLTAVAYYTLADLDPEEVKRFARGMNYAVKAASVASERERKVGIFSLSSEIRDDDVNRGLKAFLGFLRGLGQSLREPPPKD